MAGSKYQPLGLLAHTLPPIQTALPAQEVDQAPIMEQELTQAEIGDGIHRNLGYEGLCRETLACILINPVPAPAPCLHALLVCWSASTQEA
eukprot:211054-Rhodomonas_salina.1